MACTSSAREDSLDPRQWITTLAGGHEEPLVQEVAGDISSGPSRLILTSESMGLKIRQKWKALYFCVLILRQQRALIGKHGYEGMKELYICIAGQVGHKRFQVRRSSVLRLNTKLGRVDMHEWSRIRVFSSHEPYF